MIRSRRLSVLVVSCLAAGGLALLGGCPKPEPTIKKPVPSFVSAAVRRGGVGALLVRAELDVENPNSFGLELLAVDWELSVGGTAAVRGRADYDVAIAPKKSAPITLRMRLPPMLAAPALGHLTGGDKQVRVSGIMHFSSERGPVALTFDVAGGTD